ncbi:MAG: anthrone oxygenase family protein [Aeromicrobium sp.]
MAGAIVVVAVVLTGLSAGLFATFSYVVMPGLRRVDDQAFVASMRAINAAILNPVFAVVFGGAAVALTAALVTSWVADARPWLIAALVLYVVGAFVVTGAVNIPLNDALEGGSGEPSLLREAFEKRWVVWNHLRSMLTVAAFVCAVVGAVA